MKKNNMKKISVIALSALSLALVGGGMAAFTSTNVSANTDVTTSVEAYGTPQIRVLGAEEGGYAGIRFGAKINNYKESYSYGMIVAPVALFDKYETIINKDFGGDIKAAATAGGIKLVDLACLPQYGDFDQDGADEWYIQGSLVGIRPANMNADFAGVGYYYDGEKTVYDTTWRDNASSVGYVASKVIHKFDSGSALYNTCLDFANGAVAVVNDSATFEIMGTGNLSLTVNGTANMDVKQSPAMNFYVKYVSGNEDVATVSADGTITAVSTGTTTVTAYCVDKTVECEVTVAYDYVDPSFGTKKDDTYTYISDFNDSGVTQLVEKAYINAWGKADNSISMTVGQGAVANGTGLTLQGAANNVSVEFNLNAEFDLTNVDKLVIDFNYSGWHGGSLYNYVFITIGSTKVNVMPYATFYNGDDLATATVVTSSNGATYFQSNNMYGFIVIDIQSMLANADFVSAFGSGKVIDGFVFGYNGGNGAKSYCVDAVYYSVLAE